MIAAKIRTFLDQNGIRYVTIKHSPAFTAQAVAQSGHIPGKEMAKTVIVKLDEQMAMVVLPASRRVALDEVAAVVGTTNVRLAHEYEFKDLFPGCEIGAMPPFGNLYGLPVYVDPLLAENEQIAFNAGTHTEMIRMAYRDFASLVEPKIVAMTVI